MLNIRINVTLDTKKIGIFALVVALLLGHLIKLPEASAAEPINSAHFYTSFIVANEPVYKASLDKLNISTTKSKAVDALKNPYSKYYDPETMAFLTVVSKGLDLQQWQCLDMLWESESHFNPKALNMSSKAFGIAQFLPSTWGNYNVKKTTQTGLQIKYGLNYIFARYHTACAAWQFHKKHGWY